jgi:riboflavin biosynthesis pyrimidine reductase
MATPSNPSLVKLFPASAERVSLRGLYLARDLRGEIRDDRAFCFSNFVVSLDGRVSLSAAPGGPPSGVPPSLVSAGDWRLFQELVAQADAVLVSGRYVRDVAAGRAEPLVDLDRSGMGDLLAWRKRAGLAAAPDIVVLSSSLDIDPSAALRLGPRVIVMTGDAGPPERAAALRGAGIEVVVAGDMGGVDGRRLAGVLPDLGYRTVYAAAGPVMLHLLVVSGVLDRLFVTTVNRLLGGQHFATLVEGDVLQPPAGLELEALYLDTESHPNASQLFAVYRPAS